MQFQSGIAIAIMAVVLSKHDGLLDFIKEFAGNLSPTEKLRINTINFAFVGKIIPELNCFRKLACLAFHR